MYLKHTFFIIYNMLAYTIESNTIGIKPHMVPFCEVGVATGPANPHTPNDAEQQKAITSIMFVSFFTALCLLTMFTSEIWGLTETLMDQANG